MSFLSLLNPCHGLKFPYTYREMQREGVPHEGRVVFELRLPFLLSSHRPGFSRGFGEINTVKELSLFFWRAWFRESDNYQH